MVLGAGGKRGAGSRTGTGPEQWLRRGERFTVLLGGASTGLYIRLRGSRLHIGLGRESLS